MSLGRHDRNSVWFRSNRRDFGPADVEVDARTWSKWAGWIARLAETFGWRPFTSIDIHQLGLVPAGLDLNPAEVETVLLRRMVGLSFNGRHMLVATSDPRVWRIWHAATDRVSADFDAALVSSYGPRIGWPELWANRHLTPFGSLGPDAFLAAWQGWAQVDECRCGRFMAQHVDSDPDGRGRSWLIAPRACREQSGSHREMVDELRSKIGAGVAFTSGDAIGRQVESLADLREGFDWRDERAMGRYLGQWADSVPPGGNCWFPVRLGVDSATRRTAFAVVSFETVPPVVGSDSDERTFPRPYLR